jgi:hypothetical protein
MTTIDLTGEDYEALVHAVMVCIDSCETIIDKPEVLDCFKVQHRATLARLEHILWRLNGIERQGGAGDLLRVCHG